MSAADAGAAKPTNATRLRVASRNFFIAFHSIAWSLDHFVSKTLFSALRLIATSDVNPRWFAPNGPCQNGNTQAQSEIRTREMLRMLIVMHVGIRADAVRSWPSPGGSLSEAGTA
jgi:hypothetical protein